MAYATYEDVEARWRTLTADEQERATMLLEDAATILEGVAVIDAADMQQVAYLTKLDKRLLGIGGGKGRILHPAYGVIADD